MFRSTLNSALTLILLATLVGCGGRDMQKKATRVASAKGEPNAGQDNGRGNDDKVDFDPEGVDPDSVVIPVAINHVQRDCPALPAGDHFYRLPTDGKRVVALRKTTGSIEIADSNLHGAIVAGGNPRQFIYRRTKKVFWMYAGCEARKLHVVRWNYSTGGKVSLKDATYELGSNGDLTVKTNTKENGKPDQSASEVLKQKL